MPWHLLGCGGFGIGSRPACVMTLFVTVMKGFFWGRHQVQNALASLGSYGRTSLDGLTQSIIITYEVKEKVTSFLPDTF